MRAKIIPVVPIAIPKLIRSVRLFVVGKPQKWIPRLVRRRATEATNATRTTTTPATILMP